MKTLFFILLCFCSAAYGQSFDSSGTTYVVRSDANLRQWKITNATTNATDDLLTLIHNSSGTPAANFGAGITFGLATATTDSRFAARIKVYLSDVTDATRTTQFVLSLVNSAANTDVLTITGAGNATFLGTVGATNLSGTSSGTNTGDVTLSGSPTYLSLSGQVITLSTIDLSGANASGILAAARFPILTGDVTTPSGSVATTIASGVVTLAKMANIATGTLIGRNTASTGVPEALTSIPTAITASSLTTFGTSPTFVTPILGTPTSGTLTNCTFPTLNQNTTGSAAKWTTARNLAGNSVDGSANVAFANAFIIQGTSDAGLSGAQFLGSLGTGIVKNTTSTGVLSIAVAGDFPTLNQSTTGSAATLTTSRNINSVAFNGSADITVTADANTLTNTILKSTVVTSSLTSVGTLTSLTIGSTSGLLTSNAGVVSFNTMAANGIHYSTSTTAASGNSAAFTYDGTTQTILNAGIAATYTKALNLTNTTASTSGAAVQQSGSLQFLSHVWSTTATAADSTRAFTITNVPISSANPIIANLIFKAGNGGTDMNTVAQLSSIGTLNLVTGGSYQINATNVLTNNTLGTGVTASSLTSFGTSPTIVTPSITTGFTIGGTAATGTFPRGNATNFVASTLTIPNTSTTGDVFVSTGTSAMGVVAVNATANKMFLSGASAVPTWSTSTIPTSAGATANKVLLSDGTNYVLSTPTFPNASATSGKTIRSDGTNWIASTATLSDAPSTAGKVMVSDGTNWIASTPTFPNASATTLKVIKSDGTNWVASTETYAAPSTSGNLLTSDGTNWTSTAPTGTFIGTQVILNGTTTYTPTSGTKTVTLVLVGAGGGGGGVKGAASSSGAGGGGGSGGVCVKTFGSVTGTYTVAVGAFGAGGGGTTPSNGTGGGNTTFANGGTTYTAFGGSGGVAMTSLTTLQIKAGGAGGVVSTNGDVNGAGAPGEFGVTVTAALCNSGSGGSSPYGSGGVGLNSSSATGTAAAGFGSGGAGAACIANSNQTGGAGTNGVLIIYEYK